MFKKLLSVLLAVMMVVSVMAVGVVNTAAATSDTFTPEANKLYFDTEGTGWEMGTRNKVAFHIFGGDLENGLAWGASKSIGTATEGQPGVFEIDPVGGKQGYTLNPGVQYKIIFVRTEGKNWTNQTYDLLFTTDCLGHIAYCDGTEYENPVDSSKKTLAAFWKDMDATEVGPVLQISSIGNVVGTCPEEGKTPASIFTDFLTVVDSVTGTTTYVNAKKYVVEPGTKTDQQLIDDIGTGLGLTKQQVYDAFTNNSVETTWDYTVSTLPGEVVPAHTHTPGEPVQENVVPASCKAEGSYDEVVYCTGCNEELSREHKTIDKLAHTPSEAVQENVVPASCKAEGSYDEVVYCSECNEELSREHKTIDKLLHNPGAPRQENFVPASCKSEGSYDEVVYCSECNEELSREHKTIDKLAHTPGEPVQENVDPASCSAEGSYEEVVYCTECGEKLSQTHKTIDKLAHTPGEPVQENVTVTHDKTTYDEVVYCTECHAEISHAPVELPIITHTLTYVPEVPATEQAEGTKAHYTCSGCDKLFADAAGTVEVTAASLIIPKLDHVHTPDEPVQENFVPASCKAEGSYDVVVYCTSCHAEISREHKIIDKLAHTPGEPVQENVVPASCKAEGSYDEVVYCTECGAEISREHKTIDMTKHTIKIKSGKAATTEADGWKTHFYCTECGKLFTTAAGTTETTWENVRIPRIVTGKLGDVDCDGEVTVLDVTYLQRVLAGAKDRDATVVKLGDVDGDGDLSSIDVTKLQRWLLGLNQDLKIGTDV